MAARGFALTPLGEAVSFANGKSIKPGGEGAFPVYGSNGIIGYNDAPRFQNAIIIGRVGAYCGSIAYCRGKFWASDNTIVAQPKDQQHDIRFLNYVLQHMNLNRWAGGAAQPLLTQTVLKGVEAPIPKPEIQRKIASILSAYDDLIENNLRRIKILEEMAQTIYREWFVKFRFPGHEKTRLVDSPLGKIPEGWEVVTLGYLSKVIPGYAFKSKHWSDKGVPVVKIKNIRSGNIIDTEQVDHVPEKILTSKHEKYWLRHGDILIAMTGATAGKVGKLRSKRPMLLNQRVAKIEPIRNLKEYVWYSISSPDAEKRFYSLADGAAQPNMSGTQIENTELLKPSSEVLQQFTDLTFFMMSSVDNLILGNDVLRRTRDLLLPKLISGELDVSDLDIKTGGQCNEPGI